MLELEGVAKHYRGASERVRAVDEVTLRLNAGEMIAVHGPSGSGKTTLLLMIAALLRPDSGSIRFEGRDLGAMSEQQTSEYQLKDVGFIYQRFRLMPKASALENASRKLLVGGVRMSEAQARARPWLERVGLGQRIAHTPSEMSGGECQRVAIARVLACEPRLILADEPTGNLDSARGREIVQLLSSIARERSAAVLLVTHDLAALEIADRSYALRDGRLTSDAAPSPQPEVDETPDVTGTRR
ncbi:MAG TPA: ABC transporter ATP-binding protein [Solirubrobacteraceae bacterium]|jgi:putative ABC transport system ATP-binding protein|nr:ABC transporter ATP-binding protein [Solirubrobacteraceae bacterium]